MWAKVLTDGKVYAKEGKLGTSPKSMCETLKQKLNVVDGYCFVLANAGTNTWKMYRIKDGISNLMTDKKEIDKIADEIDSISNTTII